MSWYKALLLAIFALGVVVFAAVAVVVRHDMYAVLLMCTGMICYLAAIAVLFWPKRQ